MKIKLDIIILIISLIPIASIAREYIYYDNNLSSTYNVITNDYPELGEDLEGYIDLSDEWQKTNGISVVDFWNYWASTQTTYLTTYTDVSQFCATNEWSYIIPEGYQLKLISSNGENPSIAIYTMGAPGNHFDASSMPLTVGVSNDIYRWLWNNDELKTKVFDLGAEPYPKNIPFSPEGKFSTWYLKIGNSENLISLDGTDYLRTLNYSFDYLAIKGPATIINRNFVSPKQSRHTLKVGGSSSGSELARISINGNNSINHQLIFELSKTEESIGQETLELLQAIANQTNNTPSSGMTMDEAQAAMRDLRVGSQTFSVSNGNAKIRMYVDESGNLTDWTNTPHVLELDIPADTDTKFFRFRMD